MPLFKQHLSVQLTSLSTAKAVVGEADAFDLPSHLYSPIIG
ncbi:hypothetical protein GARC_0746 [Paraglaciecola arctica BSs20135]|uniref:Uncharacterized protein n=1 Tax=Paraglaciecola arctica BSs20135 TaxID=493475 RepID=K6YHS8_9ALTE|nr:hypothetical protein GARC_0746 [Paraglaciecola arctica BSs20135]